MNKRENFTGELIDFIEKNPSILYKEQQFRHVQLHAAFGGKSHKAMEIIDKLLEFRIENKEKILANIALFKALSSWNSN